jgi:hypothetical protein
MGEEIKEKDTWLKVADFVTNTGRLTRRTRPARIVRKRTSSGALMALRVPRLEVAEVHHNPDHIPLGWLVVKEPVERRGQVLPVRANQVIGRSGDVQWDDPRLSRQHARLTFEAPEETPDDPPVFHLWPFGPANPVYINGREIRGATPLHENDEIRLGGTLFVFKVLVD